MFGSLTRAFDERTDSRSVDYITQLMMNSYFVQKSHTLTTSLWPFWQASSKGEKERWLSFSVG